MKFTGTFVSIVSMLVMAGNVQAKSEGVAYSNNGCTGANSGTLNFGNAFCTPIGSGWDSIEFFTGMGSLLSYNEYFVDKTPDSATECFNVFSSSDCSTGFIEVFETPGSGCFGGLAGKVNSIQKKNC
ncbi:hypothetical protein BT96DRAFT_950187 [Gymnopus androsaceus JB14]|uniref:Uncharacterized protein n=1 Tax=Gymnopus androsaceus JB14 TaxID=1447944 RepID=A0A6A4GHK9_9AGAR|nr:hypothetical protein BT96DRAFT_950187 [Gymnopus androsaceus JB14]